LSRCMLCYAFTHNVAEFLVVYGRDDRQLNVCRWCLQDLNLLGFNASQIIGLPKQTPNTFWLLELVKSLLEASCWLKE